MNRILSASALACAACALGACTVLGGGSGLTSPGDQPVSFQWKSKDGGVTGTMSATLADGETFAGPYLEITQTAQSLQFAPMWAGWNVGWSDWPYGFAGPWDFDHGTTTTYTGKAMANLQGPGDQRMRCRFDLNRPLSGMEGGGQGKCQLAGGETIDAVFPRA